VILTKITALGTDGARVTLWFDDGTKMKTATRLVADFGLYQGMELSEEQLSALSEGVRRASARDRAVRIVSATAISEQELRQRLIRRGERPEDAQEAVEWLTDLGAVDDRAMAHRIVRRCAAKGYGAARVRLELRQKGIPREYWEEALEELPDMSGAIDAFIARRLRNREPDRQELQRIIAALQRRGHGWEEIRSALGRYTDALEDPGD